MLTAEMMEVINRCPSLLPTMPLIRCLIASEVRNALKVCLPPLCGASELLTAISRPSLNSFGLDAQIDHCLLQALELGPGGPDPESHGKNFFRRR